MPSSADIRFEDKTWIWGVAIILGYISAILLPTNFLGFIDAHLILLRGILVFAMFYVITTAINVCIIQFLERFLNYDANRHNNDINYLIYFIGIVIFIGLYMLSIQMLVIRL